jgi:hypothetical protein
VVPDVSEERIASIFRVVEQFSKATSKQVASHIPEEDTLQNHRCENLKSYTLFTV